MAWVGISIALFGDGIITVDGASGDVGTAVLLGVCLALVAMFMRSAKTVLMDYIMNKYSGQAEKKIRLAPLELVAACAPLNVFTGLVVSLSTEGTRPMYAILDFDSYLFGILILNCASAIYVNLGGMVIIKMLGAPAAQIAGK